MKPLVSKAFSILTQITNHIRTFLKKITFYYKTSMNVRLLLSANG